MKSRKLSKCYWEMLGPRNFADHELFITKFVRNNCNMKLKPGELMGATCAAKHQCCWLRLDVTFTERCYDIMETGLGLINEFAFATFQTQTGLLAVRLSEAQHESSPTIAGQSCRMHMQTIRVDA